MLYLIFWCHFFLLPESEHWVGREFFICEVLHLLHKFVPDLYSVTLFLHTSSNIAYSLSRIGSFDKILPCPHDDGQEQRLSSASIKFLWLRQILDPSGIHDLQLSTTLYRPSWAAVQNTFPVRVLDSFIHLPVVTLSDNDSKRIAAATSLRMSALLTLRTFLVRVKKI